MRRLLTAWPLDYVTYKVHKCERHDLAEVASHAVSPAAISDLGTGSHPHCNKRPLYSPILTDPVRVSDAV
jgi:hypothetical protein